jgi:hypothetical protein
MVIPGGSTIFFATSQRSYLPINSGEVTVNKSTFSGGFYPGPTTGHPVEVWPDKDTYIWFTRAAGYQNAEYYVIWGFFIPGLLPAPG